MFSGEVKIPRRVFESQLNHFLFSLSKIAPAKTDSHCYQASVGRFVEHNANRLEAAVRDRQMMDVNYI